MKKLDKVDFMIIVWLGILEILFVFVLGVYTGGDEKLGNNLFIAFIALCISGVIGLFVYGRVLDKEVEESEKKLERAVREYKEKQK